MTNLAIFAAGLVVAIPAGIVVVGLVFAAADDGRDQQSSTN
jgi:hypothetical protein